MIDLPPVLVPTLASAIMIADLLLVPITPSALDVAPTESVLRMVRLTRESRRDGRPKALLVPNKVDPRGAYNAATEAAVDSLHERWAPQLHHHTDHVNAFAVGEWTGQLRAGLRGGRGDPGARGRRPGNARPQAEGKLRAGSRAGRRAEAARADLTAGSCRVCSLMVPPGPHRRAPAAA